MPTRKTETPPVEAPDSGPTRKTKTPPVEAPDSGPLVYIGPTITRLALVTGSTYQGFPGPLQKTMAGIPGLREMFVSPKKLAKARRDLKKPATKLAKTYTAVMAAATTGG